MPRHTLAVALAITLLCSSHLAAQIAARTDEIQPGAKVRVTAPGVVAARYVGTVLARTGDTLTVGGPNTLPFAIPSSRITLLEVSRGKSRGDGAIRGMKWGTPIGLGFGVLTMGFIADCLGCATRPDSDRSGERGAWVATSTLSGVAYGALIGALVGREHWESFDLSRHTAVNFAPHGASLGLRYEF